MDMDDEDKAMFFEELGINDGLDRVIRSTYKLLDLELTLLPEKRS